MPPCQKCGKQLSSNQAILLHMKSKTCIKSDSSKKLEMESYAIIVCSLDGIILDFDKKQNCTTGHQSPVPKAHDITGKTIYDMITPDTMYRFARSHICVLSHVESIVRIENVRMKLNEHEREYNCILKNNNNQIFIYVNIA